ncbi:DUF5666 domain-containing protein [Caldimonas sp. KR1-144]|uniref:DUF5666 domain-containing protein n=1 Tax=Caldimonas sp. KR1-144 TaxID=3400911 RepID=UPI003C0F37D5
MPDTDRHERAPSIPPRWRARAAAWLAAVAACALVACGGGGGSSAGVGTGGTGSFAMGPITGFGSVVVNGVHYDDSQASVRDDEGDSGSRDDLEIGMVVEVRGSVSDDGLTGRATSFVRVAEIKGPVTVVDAAGQTFSVFGQSIRVTATTVFADIAGGLAGLSPGNVVEVYALRDADGQLAATRIERKALTVAAYDGDFRVRGRIEGLSGTAPTLRFTVASVTVTTDATTLVDGPLANDVFVGVRLAKTPAGDGSYAALRVQVKDRAFDDDVDEAELEGYVSGFVGLDQPFTVAGYPVRLDAAASFEGGLPGDLANGVRVEVEGTVVSGTLIARKVEFEDENDDSGGDDGSEAPFEFDGVATCVNCGATEGSFSVQGVSLYYDATTRFDNGVTPANLNGRNVEVKAVAQSGPDGTTFLATRIEPHL